MFQMECKTGIAMKRVPNNRPFHQLIYVSSTLVPAYSMLISLVMADEDTIRMLWGDTGM
jgi:hypothetical protein